MVKDGEDKHGLQTENLKQSGSRFANHDVIPSLSESACNSGINQPKSMQS